MNPRIKNLLSFVGGVAIGILVDFTMMSAGGLPTNLAFISLIAGFSLLIFGAPHRNPKAGLIGWGALGLPVGIFAPFVLLLMLYAG